MEFPPSLEIELAVNTMLLDHGSMIIVLLALRLFYYTFLLSRTFEEEYPVLP